MFGFGAGIFFFGYCLLEIPGAVLAQSWSARKWIAAVMMFWGVIAGITGLIQTAAQFNRSDSCLVWPKGDSFPPLSFI